MNGHLRLPVLIAAVALVSNSIAFAQGTKPAPKTAKPPAKTAPAPKQPAAPATAAAKPAPPPPPSDVRYKTTYVNADQTTESATFIRDTRERYELGDTILIKQTDQKRTVQISKGANTYLVTPDGALAAAAAVAAAQAPAPKPPGAVNVNISIIDMGERKTAFDREARRIKTLIVRQPQPNACDTARLVIETDGWYIDPPKAVSAPPASMPTPGGGCQDQITTNETGDKSLIGFPISYKTTYSEPDNKESKPTVISMDVTEFEVLRLDAVLFDIPAGMTEAKDAQQLTKAISDANEARLAQGSLGVAAREKKPGTLRVGVPEITNKTTQTVDTRALRSRLVAELEEQKIDVIPMAAAPPAALNALATELSVDYLLIGELTDLKASKPGGLTKIMKNTAGEGSGKDITEAKLNVQLTPPGGKPRLTKTTSGKDGGVGFKTGLGLAKLAGTVYLRMYMGGMYGSPLTALNTMKMMDIAAMGNPALMQMQAGLGPGIGGSNVDRTAGAAMYVMQQAMNGASAGVSQDGPSFDAALNEAIQDAGKEAIESVKKAVPVKR